MLLTELILFNDACNFACYNDSDYKGQDRVPESRFLDGSMNAEKLVDHWRTSKSLWENGGINYLDYEFYKQFFKEDL